MKRMAFFVLALAMSASIVFADIASESVLAHAVQQKEEHKAEIIVETYTDLFTGINGVYLPPYELSEIEGDGYLIVYEKDGTITIIPIPKILIVD
jgi:predicted secreted protein